MIVIIPVIIISQLSRFCRRDADAAAEGGEENKIADESEGQTEEPYIPHLVRNSPFPCICIMMKTANRFEDCMRSLQKIPSHSYCPTCTPQGMDRWVGFQGFSRED
jgi:hypothetical protein